MSGGDWKEMLVAVQEGNLPLVQYHIRNGVDPNYEHPELMTTALIESVEFGQYQIAKLLLEHGADPTLRAWMSKDSPLKIAKKKGQKDFVRLLRAYLPRRRFWPWRT